MLFQEYLTVYVDLSCILIFIFSILATKYVRRQFSSHPVNANLKTVPGPYAFPIIGNSFDFVFGARDGVARLFSKYVKTYGKTFRLWFGNKLVVVLSDPEDVKTVLFSASCLKKSKLSLTIREFFNNSVNVADRKYRYTHNFHALYNGNILAPFFGNLISLIFTKIKIYKVFYSRFQAVSAWKLKRKAYQKYFNTNIAEAHIPVMNELIYKYIEKAKSSVNGAESDWSQIMINLSLDTFLKSYLNFVISDQRKDELYGLINKLSMVLRRYIIYGFLPWPIFRSLWNFVQPLNTGEIKKSLYDFINEMLVFHEKSNKINNENVGMNEVLDLDNFAQSFLHMFEKVKHEVNEDNLQLVEILFFLVGAKDPLGYTAAACFFTLAAHPEIQEKVYDEIHQVFGDSDRLADKSDLKKLPYLDQVIKEVERLYTITSQISRECEKDIKIGPHIYPKGTTFMVNIGGIHHDPDLYPNPYRFNPDNFSPTAVGQRHRCSFIPFSLGARNCLAQASAELALKLRLVAYLRHFTFHTTKKVDDIISKLQLGPVEVSTSGYPISIKLREKLRAQ